MKRLFIVLFLIVCVVIGYNYVYQDHRDIINEEAAFSKEATQISNEFIVNSSKAEREYLNKTIEVSGTISETNTSEIILDNSIICIFDNGVSLDNSKKTITIKGRFIGYDDLLEQIKLDQCSIIN